MAGGALKGCSMDHSCILLIACLIWHAQVLDALAEIAFDPEFLGTRIEKERRAVLAEAQMMNTIEYRVDCQLLQFLHGENALGARFPIGKTEQVRVARRRGAPAPPKDKPGPGCTARLAAWRAWRASGVPSSTGSHREGSLRTLSFRCSPLGPGPA